VGIHFDVDGNPITPCGGRRPRSDDDHPLIHPTAPTSLYLVTVGTWSRQSEFHVTVLKTPDAVSCPDLLGLTAQPTAAPARMGLPHLAPGWRTTSLLCCKRACRSKVPPPFCMFENRVLPAHRAASIVFSKGIAHGAAHFACQLHAARPFTTLTVALLIWRHRLLYCFFCIEAWTEQDLPLVLRARHSGDAS